MPLRRRLPRILLNAATAVSLMLRVFVSIACAIGFERELDVGFPAARGSASH